MEILRIGLGLAPETYRIDQRLAEIHLGDWQGHSWEENRLRDPAGVAARDANMWTTRAPGAGGESYSDLSARALSWLDDLKAPTIAVSHGGVQRCIRGRLSGLSHDEIPRLEAPQDELLAWRGQALEWL
jgi:broad specificity phosphatase PhoE